MGKQIELAVRKAARQYRLGDRAAATRCARVLAGHEPRVVDGAVTAINRQAVQFAVAEAGWLPDDICQLATRRAGTAVAAYLVELVADQVQEDRGGDRIAVLTIAIEAHALLTSLPTLPSIHPPPAAAARPVDERVLARVRGLLAKAESTTYPDEAEALSAKAQELMTRYAFDRALLDSAPHGQLAAARRIWLDNPYAGAKVRLVQAVAKANRCRTIYDTHLGFVTALGDEVDLRTVELLSTSLLVQATKAMVANGPQISHSGQSRTRSYRQAFLVAYARRIGERLREVAEASVAAESEPGRLLPVLAARRKAVDELFDSLFPRTVSRPVSVTNGAGWAAGRAAADLAVLNSGQRIGKATSQISSAG